MEKAWDVSIFKFWIVIKEILFTYIVHLKVAWGKLPEAEINSLLIKTTKNTKQQ